MGSSDALVPTAPDAVTVRSNSRAPARTVKVARERPKQWAPPEGLTPQQIRAVIGAAESPRDRLLLRTLWATGARVSEVLALRAMDVHADHLVLPNRKNPSRPVKRAFLRPVRMTAALAVPRHVPGYRTAFDRKAEGWK